MSIVMGYELKLDQTKRPKDLRGPGFFKVAELSLEKQVLR
jgi:hypothetical protein